MKIGDRDMPGSRIYAEREFRENAQVLVATEAAGEGINLQFCSQMINYDIPWNPVRLEQRVGRIHRYGQEHDCIIFNFVAQNTREGRVLQKLLDRLREIRQELGTDQVFDVIGEIMPANLLERLFREMYARRLDEHDVTNRIVKEVDPGRFRAITESALEGLAKRELNLSAIVGKSVEAKERRLVPEAIEQFFLEAAPTSGIQPKEIASNSYTYRIGKVPRLALLARLLFFRDLARSLCKCPCNESDEKRPSPVLEIDFGAVLRATQSCATAANNMRAKSKRAHPFRGGRAGTRSGARHAWTEPFSWQTSHPNSEA
jgi:helicase-like protein